MRQEREDEQRRIDDEERQDREREDAENIELEQYLADAQQEAEDRADEFERTRN